MTAATQPPGYDVSGETSPEFLFSTPVATTRLTDAGALIADLKAAILTRKETNPSLNRSNVGGWHSDAGMPQWGGDAARALVRKTLDVAREITRPMDRGWADVTWAVQMWANVSGPGALHNMHVHPGNLWAAVFYVDAGDAGDADEDVGGELYFEDPRFPGAFMHATTFWPAGPDGKPQNWQHEIRPRAGDLVMFPAWLRHGVRPYRGDRERISIAMNLDPIPGAAGRR